MMICMGLGIFCWHRNVTVKSNDDRIMTNIVTGIMLEDSNHRYQGKDQCISYLPQYWLITGDGVAERLCFWISFQCHRLQTQCILVSGIANPVHFSILRLQSPCISVSWIAIPVQASAWSIQCVWLPLVRLWFSDAEPSQYYKVVKVILPRILLRKCDN